MARSIHLLVKKSLLILFIIFCILIAISLLIAQWQGIEWLPFFVSNSSFFLLSFGNFMLMTWSIHHDKDVLFLGSYGFSLFLKVMVALLIFVWVRNLFGLHPFFVIFHFIAYVLYSFIGAVLVPREKPQD